MQLEANTKRLTDEFLELTAIDAPSFGERAMADRLTVKLQELGFEVTEDDAGAQYGSETGNLYAHRAGNTVKMPLLFSAHMDTVEPSAGKCASIDQDGCITGNGEAVLGADDVCGIVEILEGIRLADATGGEIRPLEVLFTIGEEQITKGASVFDHSVIRSREAYVLDGDGPTGSAMYKAPTLIGFQASIYGRAAHAGFAPEDGINAIAIASQVISRLKQGRLDEQTTVNVGRISGGKADNIVSECCVCRGEVRSLDHQQALDQIEAIRSLFLTAAEEAGARLEFDTEIQTVAFETDETSPVCQRFYEACKKTGLPGTLKETLGVSDHNVFAQKGISGLVLTNGMSQVHSVQEYCYLDDLKSGAELVAALILNKL